MKRSTAATTLKLIRVVHRGNDFDLLRAAAHELRRRHMVSPHVVQQAPSVPAVELAEGAEGASATPRGRDLSSTCIVCGAGDRMSGMSRHGNLSTNNEWRMRWAPAGSP